MATQLKYTDGFAKVGATDYPRGSISWSRISTTHIQFTNAFNGSLILRAAVADLTDENGDAYASQDALVTWLEANFPKAGGAALNFSAITDSIYTGGNKYRDISGSSASTTVINATSGGTYQLFNSGSATTHIFENTDGSDSETYTINAVGTNDGLSSFWITVAKGKFNVGPDLNGKSIAIPVPDTTAPTATWAATSATNIRGTFNEGTGNVSVAGFTYKINAGTATAFSAVTHVSGNIYDFTAAGLAAGQTITISYDPITGDTTDDADTPNELAVITDGSVTNSISAGWIGMTFTSSSVTTSAQQVTNDGSQGAGFGNIANANKHRAAGTDAAFRVTYKTGDGNCLIFFTSSSTPTGYSNAAVKLGHLMEPSGAGVYSLKASGSLSASVTSVANNDMLGVFIESDVAYLRKSTDGGATWGSDLDSAACVGTAYVGIDMNGSGGICDVPECINMV